MTVMKMMMTVLMMMMSFNVDSASSSTTPVAVAAPTSIPVSPTGQTRSRNRTPRGGRGASSHERGGGRSLSRQPRVDGDAVAGEDGEVDFFALDINAMGRFEDDEDPEDVEFDEREDAREASGLSGGMECIGSFAYPMFTNARSPYMSAFDDAHPLPLLM